MFCLPVVKFFKAIGEFCRTLRELRSSLQHLREILSSVLRVTQDIEDLTGEVKSIVDFYSNESKDAVRVQFEDLLTTEGKDRLFYRDFTRSFKYLTHQKISCFLHDHHYTKQTLLVAIELLQKLRYTINMMKTVVQEDEIRLNVLDTINDDVYGLLQNYEHQLTEEREENSKNMTDNLHEKHPDLFGHSKEKLDIKLFCDKQKILCSLESTLSYHMGVHFETAADDGFDTSFVTERPEYCQLNIKELVYRERATRIHKLRKYLTQKIKLKKIGDFYREEISLQIQVDLKQAAEDLEIFESSLHEVTSTWIETLKQLPKHRFKDVLAEEKLIDVGEKISTLVEETVISNTDVLLKEINITSALQQVKQASATKVRQLLRERTNQNQTQNFVHLLETSLNDTNEDVFENITDMLRRYKKLKNCGRNNMIEYDVNKIDDDVTDEKNLFKSVNLRDIMNHETLHVLTPWTEVKIDTVISDMLTLDRDIIIDDVKQISQPIISFLVRKSSHWLILTVDKTLLTASDIISTISTLMTSSDDDVNNCKENIFLSSIVQLFPDIGEDDFKNIVMMYKAFRKRKRYKEKFLKKIENRLSGKLMVEGKALLQKKGEQCLSECIENIIRTSL